MKSIAVTVLIVLLIIVMGLYLISFQVREVESALVMTFGKPTREITEPGWYLKWPIPIQRVYRFDSRLRVFEADPVETTTKEAASIILNTYVVWKIAKPLPFYNANGRGNIREAEKSLLSQINDTQNKVVGRHFFSEFVNSDPSKIRFAEIEDEMYRELKQVEDDYGIEIGTLGIKQLSISEDVSQKVFERMKEERERMTVKTISEGNSEAMAIRTDANSIKTVLLAAARGRATAIRGKGDADAAKYYEMLEADPELAMFLRGVEALKKTLEKRSTYFVPMDIEPFRYIKEMPDIIPGDANKPE
ncbi:MAG: protease modulator HflC [Planctomycetota bacterium]|jgi:membrane protease subunit HflC